MDYLEILVAADVSKICIEIRREEANEYAESIENEPNRQQLLDKWMGEHPTSDHVPQALAHLKKIAAEIARIESEPT